MIKGGIDCCGFVCGFLKTLSGENDKRVKIFVGDLR